jgi:hypothetical protein
MRKTFILTGLLMISVFLVFLISAERSNLFRNNFPDRKKVLRRNFEYRPDMSESNIDSFVQDGKLILINGQKGQEFLEKYIVLAEQQDRLEQISSECRLVIEKAAIEDSVYDQYDNPDARLQRYKVDQIVKRFFMTNKALKTNHKLREQLKKQFQAVR